MSDDNPGSTPGDGSAPNTTPSPQSQHKIRFYVWTASIIAVGLLSSRYLVYQVAERSRSKIAAAVEISQTSAMISEDDSITLEFRLQSNMNSPVALVGADACCECKIQNSFPFRIEPKESRIMSVVVSKNALVQGRYNRTIELMTDSVDAPVLAMRVEFPQPEIE